MAAGSKAAQFGVQGFMQEIFLRHNLIFRFPICAVLPSRGRHPSFSSWFTDSATDLIESVDTHNVKQHQKELHYDGLE